MKDNEMKKKYLTISERETIISWRDRDANIFIYSSQQPMIRKLRKNKLFELTGEHFNKNYARYPEAISIEGYVPKNALTIRTKIVRLKLTMEQKREIVERLRRGRKK